MIPADKAADSVFAQGLLRSDRLLSVDLLRGCVMIIMALDHTRDFFTYPRPAPEFLPTATVGLFFTRWITHFVAPTFFFLAGAGAFLSIGRGKSVAQVSRFLWTRGLWLVFLELTVIGFGMSFQFGNAIGEVIWALGWSMVFMGALVRLPVKWAGIIGVAIIALHNLLDHINPASFGKLAPLWTFLYVPGVVPAPRIQFFFIAYTVIPWLGLMAAGYAFGSMLRGSPGRRQRAAFRWGVFATLAFLLLRVTNLYGNPPANLGFGIPFGAGPWIHGKTFALTVISFFNVSKYPPSLQFVLMTLGPALLALAWIDRLTQSGRLNWLGRILLVYGRVPLFYFVLHISLIHLMAVLAAMFMHQPYGQMLHGGVLASPREAGYGHGLPFIYLMWVTVVVLLYWPCAWFAGVKARRKDWWLSYL